MSIYALQNRWKPEGKHLVYYGLRQKENLFHNRVRLGKAQQKIVAKLPCVLSPAKLKTLGALVGVQVVPEAGLRTTPKSLREARFCRTCVSNDFMIPGLEFDKNGQCPMCATADLAERLKSVLPVCNDFPRAKNARFDVAVFYTGGKDSTYLLYYLAKVRRLRVLAMTWEIPYISESARASIENAKKHFDTVEFVTRTVSHTDLRRFYRALYQRAGNTCACPSLAYLLFYPTLVAERVPYFVAGNEPVQVLGLYYNHMAPKMAYSFSGNRLLHFLYNTGRVLTLRPPLRGGQIQALLTMRQLAFGNPLVKLSGYENELLANVTAAIREVPEFLPPLRRSVRYSSRTGRVPAFVHIDFDRICGGTYNWNLVKELLVKECGWVAPEESAKALHTSCSIERCKDHTQFLRFYHCQSKTIPFSAIEISLSSRNCGRSREETVRELETSLGFTLEELPECRRMCAYMEQK